MNSIQQVESLVRLAVPGATVVMDPPGDLEVGAWFLDIVNGVKHVIVEWKAGYGFGVSLAGEKGTPEEIFYGEKPQHFHEKQEDALQKTLQLLA